jgi:hypothetical protein
MNVLNATQKLNNWYVMHIFSNKKIALNPKNVGLP